MRFRHGDARGAARRSSAKRHGKSGTEVTFLPSPADLHQDRIRFRHAGTSPARAGLPEFRRHHRAQPTSAASRRRKSRCTTKAGWRPSCDYLDRAKNALIPAAGDDRGRARRHHGGNRADLERQLSRKHAGLHQQHPAARRRHPSGRLPRRPDARGDEICRRHAARQEGQGGADRRRLPRRPDLRAVGQGARSEILVPDQGQAGLVRSASRGGRRGDRPAGRWFEEHPAEAKAVVGKVVEAAAGARGRPQGARTDPAQGRAGRRLAARQAGRLPGTRSRQMRNLHRRGRQRRRQRQAGAQPRQPGGAAPARQDPEYRARPLRQDAVQRGDRQR